MHKATYRVINIALFGIISGGNVEVLWVYNERVPERENNLPPEIKSMIGARSLGNFPDYRTFFQNFPRLVDLRAKQVNMLAHLSSWNIMENNAEFERMLSE